MTEFPFRRCCYNRRTIITSAVLLIVLLSTLHLVLGKGEKFENETVSKSAASKALLGVARDTKAGKRLEFVHIPKTSGTMMEMWAGQHNITWGKCHWKKSHACPNDVQLFPKVTYPSDPLDHLCSVHHIPPYIFSLSNSSSPYQDVDLFTVVRNPYDRFLSEYYHQNKKKENVDDPDSLNAFAQHVFRELKLLGSNRTSNVYYMQYCHYVPQVDFIFDATYDTQIVENVLYYENLQQGFAQLARRYPELGVLGRLPSKNESGTDAKHFEHQLTVANMTRETLRFVEEHYKKDFDVLGYDVLSRPTSQTRMRNGDIS